MPERPPDEALRLYPLPTREVSPTAIHRDLPIIHRREGSHAQRPHVVVNMISSVDGLVAVEGKASRIGSEIDRHTMRNLRASSDAVMVGANTLRAERLSLGLDETSPGVQQPRRAQPLAVVLTTTGDVPIETNLVFHEGQTVLVISGGPIPEDRRAEVLRANATVQRVPATSSGRPDLSRALEILKREHAVERLLVEGGPTLNRALISAGLVDELFLTVAPKLLGAPAQGSATILAGALPASVDLHLLSAHLAADELFLHYTLSSETN